MKKIICVFISMLLMMHSIQFNKVQGQEANYSNLVIFVDFSDYDHSSHSYLPLGECFLTNGETTLNYFNGSESYRKGLSYYLSEISYNQFNVENIIPQYNESSNQISSIKLSNSASYYYQNDSALIEEVIEKMNSSGLISSSRIVDRDNDGLVDNLQIIVSCESGDSNTLMYGHSSTYYSSGKINNKRVFHYNIIPESSMYCYSQGGSLAIHEFMHSIGYPDLYRNQGTTSTSVKDVPVGFWCIMSSVTPYTQYPLAYLRSSISNWFSIPTVTTNQTGYTIYSATSASNSTKNKQAVILRTPYSSTEFFVIEYRQQGYLGYKNGTYYENDYDARIYGSGIIIYRVNTTSTTNHSEGADMIYIFRPNDTLNSSGCENGGGDLDSSFLSLESGRTSYGSSISSDGIEQNAIVYSDGINSGIVISNVSSAENDTISFDITFNSLNIDYWETVVQEPITDILDVRSTHDNSNNIFFLTTEGNYSSTKTVLYKYNGSSLAKLGQGPSTDTFDLCVYNNELYLAYLNNNFKPTLAKWNGSGFTTIFQSSITSYEISITSDSTGIFMGYICSEEGEVYVYHNGEKKIASINTSYYPSNPVISAENGKAVYICREAFNNNTIDVYYYNGTSWNQISSDIHSQSSSVLLNSSKIYVSTNEAEGSYIYTYDLASSIWSKDTNSFCSETLTDPTIIKDDYLNVIYLNSSTQSVICMDNSAQNWNQLGEKVENGLVNGLNGFVNGNEMIITYLQPSTSSIFIKKHALNKTNELIKVAAKNATCLQEGNKEYYKDSSTGKYYADSVKNTEITLASVTIPALGHNVVIDSEIPATCTANGLSEGSHCSRCNILITAQQPTDKLGHNIVKDPAIAATCTSDGLSEGSHCSRCKATIVAQQAINKLGHSIVTDSATPATCTSSGLSEGSHCSRCNQVIQTQSKIEALGHAPINQNGKSICSRCNTILATYEQYNIAIFANEKSYGNKDNHIIYQIAHDTTVAQLISATTSSNYNAKLQVTDSAGKELNSSDVLSTGDYLIIINQDGSTQKAVLAISGDVNGDGLISSQDYVMIKNHIMDQKKITTDYLILAADISNDQAITSLDYVMIKNIIMSR